MLRTAKPKLEPPVEEDLRLTLYVAGDVVTAPRGEFGEFFPALHHGVLREAKAAGRANLCWR